MRNGCGRNLFKCRCFVGPNVSGGLAGKTPEKSYAVGVPCSKWKHGISRDPFDPISMSICSFPEDYAGLTCYVFAR